MILLDTHVVIWMNADSRRLSRLASAAIRRSQRQGGLAISAISLVELARLIANNRVESTGPVEATINQLIEGIFIKPITTEIAAFTTYLPPNFPSDPADRTIAATARVENLALVTADQRIRSCPLLKTIW